MKRKLFLLLFVIPAFVSAESLYSPTWGFGLDLPEGYDYIDGDGKDRFSFSGPGWINFDLVVYNGAYNSVNDLAEDVNRRIGNKGSVDFFNYHDKKAAIMELNFGGFSGWALCVTLARPSGAAATAAAPMLIALSYSPADDAAKASNADLSLFHFSALDSIIPSNSERYYPGPIMEYCFPRGEQKSVPLALSGASAMIRDNDAEAAQVLIEREFNVLANYANTPYWQEAWLRYYRFIFRDSVDRVSDAASALVRHLRANSGGDNAAADLAITKKALAFVQGFKYERDLAKSDFVNLVTAVTEGRGDCDSRAMLWAIILAHADIRAAMMVSRHYSHAMGLVDIAGDGARFESYGIKWLVAETTADVDLGLIAQDVSDPAHWIGIMFE